VILSWVVVEGDTRDRIGDSVFVKIWISLRSERYRSSETGFPLDFTYRRSKPRRLEGSGLILSRSRKSSSSLSYIELRVETRVSPPLDEAGWINLSSSS
jgi:hypothetical protein